MTLSVKIRIWQYQRNVICGTVRVGLATDKIQINMEIKQKIELKQTSRILKTKKTTKKLSQGRAEESDAKGK